MTIGLRIRGCLTFMAMFDRLGSAVSFHIWMLAVNDRPCPGCKAAAGAPCTRGVKRKPLKDGIFCRQRKQPTLGEFGDFIASAKTKGPSTTPATTTRT
jgi:hypothetical protein